MKLKLVPHCKKTKKKNNITSKSGGREKRLVSGIKLEKRQNKKKGLVTEGVVKT